MTLLRCRDRRFEPQVREGDEGFEITVAGRTFRFALEEGSPGTFVLRDGGRTVRFHVAREGEDAQLFWNGVVYAFTEEREGTRRSGGADAGTLEAPMPGRVTAVRTRPGDRVTRGQELVVVEAMKMENALRAPRAGVVRAVHAKPGDMVAPGRPLVEIETEP